MICFKCEKQVHKEESHVQSTQVFHHAFAAWDKVHEVDHVEATKMA